MKELRNELEAQERIGDQKHKGKRHIEQRNNTSTTEVLRIELCAYCKTKALLRKTQNSGKLRDPKKEMLDDKNRCYICTRQGHLAKDCTYKIHVSSAEKDFILVFAFRMT